jgi:hypothetical protein
MEDIKQAKSLSNPIGFFFAGAFGEKKYLWDLTAKEEESGSGYHKAMIKATEAGKSPIAGLKEM